MNAVVTLCCVIGVLFSPVIAQICRTGACVKSCQDRKFLTGYCYQPPRGLMYCRCSNKCDDDSNILGKMCRLTCALKRPTTGACAEIGEPCQCKN